MSKKNGVIIASAIIILTLLGGAGAYLYNKNRILKDRNSKLELINEYLTNNNYTRAEEVLSSLLLNSSDDELIQLASQIKSKEEDYLRNEELKAKFKESITNDIESIYLDNILDEFSQLKDELLLIDPSNSKIKAIIEGIDNQERDLLQKVQILMNSMFNAKSEEEADALKKMIYDLLDESKSDFIRSQVNNAEIIKNEILEQDPNNNLANKLDNRLAVLKKELQTKEEKAAFKKKIDRLLNDTQKLLEDNKFQEAETLRKSILDLDPSNRLAQDLEEKIKEREEEKKLNDKVSNLISMAEAAINSKLFDSAEKYRQEIIQLDPKNKDVAKLKETILKKEKEEFNKQVEELISRATNAIDKGQLDYAEDLRQEVAKLDPTNPRVKELINKIKQKERELADKKEQERLKEINKLITQAKKSFENKALLESEDQFNKVLLLDNNNLEALKGLADISIINSKSDKSEIPRSIRKVLNVLDREPNNLDYLKSLVDLYNRNEDFKKELSTLDRVLKLDPTADFYVKAGIASYKLTQYENAAQYLDSAIGLDSSYPEIYYPYALTFEKLGDNDNREAMLKKGSSLRPNHAATLYELGRYYTDKENYSEALNLFLKAYGISKDSVKYQMGVALAYFNLKEFDKSIKIYESILSIDKTKSEVYYNLSMARMEIGQYDQALTDISLAIKLKPNSPTYIYTIGQISEALGRDDNAISYYLAAVKLDNNYYKPMLNLGNIYDRFGRYEDGLKILQLAYKIKPDDPDVRFSLGTSYLHNKMYNDSLKLLEESYNNDKNSTLKLYNLSLAYTEVGNSEAAEKGFKKVLEMDSNFYDAYYYLGQLLFTLDRQEEARTYLKQVLELNPEYKYKDKIKEVL